MTADHDAPNVSNPPTVKRSRKRRIVLSVVYLGYLTLLGWLGLQLFFWIEVGGGSGGAESRDNIWNFFYRELSRTGALDVATADDPDTFTVLLLGGSVLEQTAVQLEADLAQQTPGEVKVYNLARAAHTTRDSMLKYSRLGDRHFDLVVFYHGINDVRMNCISSERFRDDYSHCAWYNRFEAALARGELATRDVLSQTLEPLITRGEPDSENIQFGNDVKTESAFRKNCEAVLKQALEHRQQIVLMTFAYHLPAEYTRERYFADEFDYGKGHYRMAVESWGPPDGVRRAIDTHNRVITELAAAYPDVIFVDQYRLLSADSENFSDVCHLTDRGIERFVANLLAAIRERAATPKPDES